MNMHCTVSLKASSIEQQPSPTNQTGRRTIPLTHQLFYQENPFEQGKKKGRYLDSYISVVRPECRFDNRFVLYCGEKGTAGSRDVEDVYLLVAQYVSARG